MKYHKIRGVALEVCTAEQKIAYNIAARNRDIVRIAFETKPTAEGWREYIAAFVETQMHLFRCAYDYTPGKYDEEAIAGVLAAGIGEYIARPYHIAGSYAAVGEWFPKV